MPTTEEEQTNKSIPLAMQALFYKVSGGLVLWACSALHSAGADLSFCQKTAVATSLTQVTSGSLSLLLVALCVCVCLRLALVPLCSALRLRLRLTLAVLTAAAIW